MADPEEVVPTKEAEEEEQRVTNTDADEDAGAVTVMDTTEEPAQAEEAAEAPAPAAADDGAEADASAAAAEAAPEPEPAASGSPALSQPSTPPAVLRLRGIPFAANEGNILAFFATAEDIRPPLEVYICRRNGRSTGECYVVLHSAEEAISARHQLDKRHIGHRYIEIFEASMPDLEAVRKILEDMQPRGHCLHLRGLPFSATAADVAAFLSGIELAGGPEGIVFTYTSDGRPTGECYIEVADEAGAAAAMEKHKERMGPRYIEVFASTKHDLLQASQQAHFQQSQAALRRRWAALGPAGGGGPGGGGPGAGGVAARVAAAAAAAGLPAAQRAQGGGYGGAYGGQQYGQAPQHMGPPAGVMEELAQAFQGVGLHGGPQAQPGAQMGAYMMAGPDMMLQYGAAAGAAAAAAAANAAAGGMHMGMPYYILDPAAAARGAPQQAAQLQQQQALLQQQLPGGVFLQQGMYVPGFAPQGGAPPLQPAIAQQMAPAAAAQQQAPQGAYVQAAQLQQWGPAQGDGGAVPGAAIWGYGSPMQPGVFGQAQAGQYSQSSPQDAGQAHMMLPGHGPA